MMIMSGLAARVQTTVFMLRTKLREERGEGGVVVVSIITAALVILAIAVIAAMQLRAQPAIDEITP